MFAVRSDDWSARIKSLFSFLTFLGAVACIYAAVRGIDLRDHRTEVVAVAALVAIGAALSMYEMTD